jgi:Fe-S-cluster-containing hydrogenase component 2
MAACSFNGVCRDGIDQTIIACDLCGGNPKCVRFCETKAIEFLERDSVVVQKKNESLEEFRELIKLVEGAPQSGLD